MTNNNIPYYYNINYQRQLEKRNTRKTLSGLGFLLFTAELVFQFLFLLFELFIAITGLYSNSFFSENYLAIGETYHATVLFIGFFLIGLLYCCLSSTKLPDVIHFEKVKADRLIAYVLLGLGVAYLGNILCSIFLKNLSYIGINDLTDSSSATGNTAGMIIMTFVTAVTPALAEEFMFRGIILGKMKKYGDSFAVFASAFLFAIMHGNLQQIPFAFIGGIFFAFITLKTNSLLPAILIHFSNNLISCFLQMIVSCGNSYIENLVPVIIFTVVLLLSVLSFVYLIKKDKNFLSFNKTSNTGVFPFRENIKLFFSNTGTIFAIILLFFETMENVSITF